MQTYEKIPLLLLACAKKSRSAEDVTDFFVIFASALDDTDHVPFQSSIFKHVIQVKILVTGANGQLGTELRKALEATMPGLTTYTDIDTLDLTDAAAVSRFIERGDYTHIINCAAYTDVDKAEQEPAVCLRINSDAVRNIAAAAYEIGAKVIHISTDYVFDGTNHVPYREGDKVNPISTYGTSKRRGEMVLLSLCPESIIIRTSGLYSPHGHNFVKTMLRLARERKRISVVCDQISTPTSATDLAGAIVAILRAHQWVPGLYHYAGEGACSWYDFAKAVHRIAGVTGCEIVPISTEDYVTENSTSAARPHYSVLDKQRIKKTFNITIPHWEESLTECIRQLS